MFHLQFAFIYPQVLYVKLAFFLPGHEVHSLKLIIITHLGSARLDLHKTHLLRNNLVEIYSKSFLSKMGPIPRPISSV